jgi:predicted phage terminase large subunit-like protein
MMISPHLSPVSPLEAATELQTRRQARNSLLGFTTYTKRDYQINWHHRLLCEYLNKFIAKEIKRLMVFMPPRHGKSELVSRRLPAYILGRVPDASIIACSYSSDLAQRMNRDVQRIMTDKAYSMLFPESSLFGKNIRTIADGSWLRNSDIFEIVGRRGVYRAAGVGGGITGMGFDYGIIDDPIKNREEADSLTVRDSVWDWYGSTFYTRAEKNASILLTMTRWHSDDLAARILESAEAKDWTVLSFPAICEAPSDIDPRVEGEALWEDKYNLTSLAQISAAVGSYSWASLYQQRPRPREGGMFKEHWLELVDAVPAGAVRVRWWDRAATDGAGDYTAGVLIAYHEGVFYVEDVVRGQWSSGERDKIIRHTADRDAGRYGYITYWGEQEPGSSGKDAALSFVRLLMGYNAHTEPTTGNKEQACEPLAAQAEVGNVKVLRSDWTATFVTEACDFPSGKHDDMIESAARAANKIAAEMGEAAGEANYANESWRFSNSEY